MRNVITAVLFVMLSFAGLSTAQQKPASPAAPAGAAEASGRLPVKRVVLYQNGVGYFEHSTRVRGTQDLNIDFTSAQLNDVLKSLTVVDLGEGRITGVRFNSVAPLSERLKTLRLPLGEDASRKDLLEALRGTRVEVRSGPIAAPGKLLSVEVVKRFTGKEEQMEEVPQVTLVTDAGEVRSFELWGGTSVRIADHELADEVNRYLNLVGSARAVDLRRLTISAAGTGEREIFVSYISEVPVWKSTYRILLDAKAGAKPLMQGWAVVDNTIGEDWKDVQLSLVAGAPQSFVQNISQPMYVRRPEVPLPQAAMLTPQTHEAAMMPMAAPAPPPPPPGEGGGIGGGVGVAIAPGRASLEGTVKDMSGAGVGGATVTVRNEATGESRTTTTDPQGYYRFNDIPAGNSALFVQAPGFHRFALTNIYIGVGRLNEIHPTLSLGTVSESVEVRAAAPQLATESASVSTAAERAQPAAQGKGVGDYFEYDLKEKVTIGKNQSALVPILQTRIDAEKVTLWNEDSDQALRALWLHNTSGMTLDAGSFNILDDETFAGEGMLDAVRPGEKRLISYAADPAVRIQIEEDSSEKPFSRIRVVKGTMLMTKEERETKTYNISNSDSAPRDVIIEHPARPEWKLAEGVKPEETSASFLRFRVKVEPQKSAQLVVEEYHPLETELALTNLTSDHIAMLVEQKRMTPAMEKALKRVLDQKAVIEGLDAQLNARQQEVDSISSDQARIRENMKALKGSPEEKTLLQRYTRQLDEQEDRLAALRSQIADLKGKRQQASQQLDQILAEISLDESF
jgi:hypothetical protein